MEILTTTIKLIAGDTGADTSGNGSVDAQSSLVATGDFAFLFLLVFVLICGTCAIGVILLRQKQTSVGVHVLPVNRPKLIMPIIILSTIILTMSIAFIGFGQSRALANQNGSLTGGEEIIGTVNMQSDATTFADAVIINNGDNPEKIENFAISAAEAVDLSSVVWKITIGDTVVYNQKLGEEGSFTPFYINAKSQAIMRVEASGLTAELAKPLIGKNIAKCETKHEEVPCSQFYGGVVQTPENGRYVGVAGAEVNFVNSSTNGVISTTTDVDGSYVLIGADVGIAGSITVSKASSGAEGDYGYSSDSFEVDTTKSLQNPSRIGKLVSLQVAITDGTTGSTTYDRNTCWCPVIPDACPLAIADIKFYDFNGEFISDNRGDNKDGYSMKDIACPSDKKSLGKDAAYKYQANYFAFCTLGQTVNCFQTVGLPWTEAFSGPDIGVADTLKIDDIKRRVSSKNNSFRTVYLDGANWVKEWGDDIKWSASSPVPVCLAYQYSRNSDIGKKDNLVDIYGNVDTGLEASSYKDESGILCPWAYFPWSAKSRYSDGACRWWSNKGWWDNYDKFRENAIVVLQSYSL